MGAQREIILFIARNLQSKSCATRILPEKINQGAFAVVLKMGKVCVSIHCDLSQFESSRLKPYNMRMIYFFANKLKYRRTVYEYCIKMVKPGDVVVDLRSARLPAKL